MAGARSPFILIPIVLDVLVLAILPKFAMEQGLARAILISLLALAFPWILFFIISAGMDHDASKEAERRKAEDNQDFV